MDDLADAVLFLMLNYDEPEIINVGIGTEISIRDLAELIVRVTGCRSKLVFDTSKPDGTPRKLLDNSCLTALGWKPRIGLEEGIASAYQWYVESLRPKGLGFGDAAF